MDPLSLVFRVCIRAGLPVLYEDEADIWKHTVSGDLVIDIRDVSKAFPLYAKHSDILKEMVFGGVRHDVFWALRDVSLTVRAGQRVGIIGPNGAGKSTLLQIISGNLQPTTGSVLVHGSISALLSLVPAWNLEQTGIENIRFNLLLRGCSTQQIRELTEEITDFSELGEFIHQPVKTYSAGMGARLSFAIATSVSPEILIVDEVLGAGDSYFAAKAAQRMKEFCNRGKALLFVSHSIAAIQQMCDSTIWLENGSVRMLGSAADVLQQYELDFRRAEDEATRRGNRQASDVLNVLAFPDEIVGADRLRFRILGGGGGRFSATHFITGIAIIWEEGAGGSCQIPVEFVNLNAPCVRGALDLGSCEWGRLHEKKGLLSRLLSRQTGRKPGGHFVVKLPPAGIGMLSFTVEVASIIADEMAENLSLEVLDAATGHWRSVIPSARSRSGEEMRQVFSGELRAPTEQLVEGTKALLVEQNLPDAEILRVELRPSFRDIGFIVRERESFEIRVVVRFNNPVDMADVGIKITRVDGLYVFWQSSGQVGANLISPEGELATKFEFIDGLLGAGEYSVSAFVSNGWSYPDNYPYSQVYARTVSALDFRVVPECDGLDMGVLNARIPVTIEKL